MVNKEIVLDVRHLHSIFQMASGKIKVDCKSGG